MKRPTDQPLLMRLSVYTKNGIKSTAMFIGFCYSFRELGISTIERKISHTESKCRIKLDGEIGNIL